MEHVVLSVRYEEIQNGNCINLYERTENIEISWTKNAKWGSFSLFWIANIVEAEQNISVFARWLVSLTSNDSRCRI